MIALSATLPHRFQLIACAEPPKKDDDSERTEEEERRLRRGPAPRLDRAEKAERRAEERHPSDKEGQDEGQGRRNSKPQGQTRNPGRQLNDPDDEEDDERCYCAHCFGKPAH